MIVLDVVVDGTRVETVRPANQRPQELYWIMVDLMDRLQSKYGTNVSLYRRLEHAG
ncbi:mechanosensitive ion channel protein MscL [Gorillibacterium sp. sgz5001074]|uniref:mechanosensitive ion channel protein MscL n=1 Tax=Gorillibacterium sp. sgz5001074 TaxID=3446695 RepID=UPI003F67C6DE